MSKRQSIGQKNTLFNYFSSPKTQKTDTVELPKTEPDSDPVEDSPVKLSKRKRSAVIDSDSDTDSPPITETPKAKRKTRVVSNSDEETETPKAKKQKKAAIASVKAPDKTEVKPAPVLGDIHTNWLHNKLEFLRPENIKDINLNRPQDENYDSRTVFIPKAFLDSQTPAMRQWWVLKSAHFDSVLFFKVGKFYELYHMDAVVGVTELGFSYMKGEFAHSGFPEVGYNKMASALIEKGFKVARTEQTETPEMMAERCKKMKKTTKFDKVVNREICQISAKGSCVYSAQLPDAMHSLPCYMYAITEKDILSNNPEFGICFVDTSLGAFHLTEFIDDKHCSKLLLILSQNIPGVILTERGKVSQKLSNVLRTQYRDIRNEVLTSGTQFYTANKTIDYLLNGNYFRTDEGNLILPPALDSMIEGCNVKPGFELIMKAFGACLYYLKNSLLDMQVVSMGKFKFVDYDDMGAKDPLKNKSLILDSAALQTLDLLGSETSLERTLDNCSTHFGKRTLQQWICRPLCDAVKIKERQEAVKELYTNSLVLEEAVTVLKQLPDLERQLAKLHTYGNYFFAKDHPDSRAVFYEAKTYSKRRIHDLLVTLKGFEVAQELTEIFKDCSSELLRKLTQFHPTGRNVDLSPHLKFFKKAFDEEEATKEGKITPKLGVDDAYDEIENTIKEIKRELAEYLDEQKRFFSCKVSYFGSDKKRFQLEIPDPHNKKVTMDYQLEGIKKGAKRYSTDETREFLARTLKAESERAKIIGDLNRRIFEKFTQKREDWEKVIACLTELDVLCSFAQYARNYAEDICVPEVEPFSEDSKFIMEGGRHPCVTDISNFVPNDFKSGVKDHANIVIITGPNMGGKSTIMRQIAIICVMAQMGSYVPASKCQFNVIDKIFTRIGANDDIMGGESTFRLELTEASMILMYATKHSLVLLDELGRGTSTHDGNAIATAYISKLITINCRTLFSTHYHSLVGQYENRQNVQLTHMGCLVEKSEEDPLKEVVTFLYKIVQGRCPASYGFNVAELAGLKSSVVNRGRSIAKQLEEQAHKRTLIRQLLTASDLLSLRSAFASIAL